MNPTISIIAFLIGASTTYFTMTALRLFFDEKLSYTRLHRIIGWVFVFFALNYGKDIILTFDGMYTSSVLEAVIVADGWSALAYMAVLFEITKPGWLTHRKMLISSAPFALTTAYYIINPSEELITFIIIALIFFGLFITIAGFNYGRTYMNYIHTHYSNIEEIDISWLRKIYVIATINLLLWLLTSFAGSFFVDCLYYIISVFLWHRVYVHCRHLKQVTAEEAESCNEIIEREYAFAGILEKVIEQEKLYLNPTLALDDLAKRLKTNRTYLSTYFSTVIGKSFYDYINELRILKESIPLMESHPEYTLEYIAQQSGYNSISTFRRAFQKHKNMSPSEYRLLTADSTEPEAPSQDLRPTEQVHS